MNVEQMIELGSGCVCCTINYRFGLALQEIVETVEPELIIVETTGVADPPNIVYETKQVGFNVDATIAVVDTANFERHLDASEVTREQVRVADFIVLNKTDLVDAAHLDTVRASLATINPRALVVATQFGKVESDVLFGTAARSHVERLRALDSPLAAAPGHLARDGITAFTHATLRPFVRERFEAFLEALPKSIYRAKGVVTFTDSDWSSFFNFTCGRTDYEWREKVGAGFVGESVFIGKDAAAMRDELVSRLDACQIDGVGLPVAERR
jgi:G3E family GTPase